MHLYIKRRPFMGKSRISALSCLPLLLLASCANQGNKVTYIGIISAMENEVALLLDEASIKEKKTIGGITFHVGTLNDKPVVISQSGIGKIYASAGMTSLLNTYDVSKVIFTGIAGGTRDDEKILDEVIATSIVEHDFGYLTNDGFVWGGGDPGKLEEGECYYPDKELSDLAYDSAISLMGSERVHRGLIATGDQFIASKEYVEKLQKDFDAYACEMEGAAIAKVCTAYEKPFCVIRTLSDKADGEAQDTYVSFGDEAADQSNRIVMKMLESL